MTVLRLDNAALWNLSNSFNFDGLNNILVISTPFALIPPAAVPLELFPTVVVTVSVKRLTCN